MLRGLLSQCLGVVIQEEALLYGWMDHRAVKQAERINSYNSTVLHYCGGVSSEMEPPKELGLLAGTPLETSLIGAHAGGDGVMERKSDSDSLKKGLSAAFTINKTSEATSNSTELDDLPDDNIIQPSHSFRHGEFKRAS